MSKILIILVSGLVVGSIFLVKKLQEESMKHYRNMMEAGRMFSNKMSGY